MRHRCYLQCLLNPVGLLKKKKREDRNRKGKEQERESKEKESRCVDKIFFLPQVLCAKFVSINRIYSACL